MTELELGLFIMRLHALKSRALREFTEADQSDDEVNKIYKVAQIEAYDLVFEALEILGKVEVKA